MLFGSTYQSILNNKLILKMSNAAIFYSCISISGSIPSSLQERTAREAKLVKQKFSTAKTTKDTNSAKSGFKRDISNSGEYIKDQTEIFKLS